MPITRTPIVDDDGSGTSGTVLDNAWKTELYNQIDGLVPATAWAAYTPVWGTYGAPALALGNGTIAGSFITINGITYFELTLTSGSSSTFGPASGWTFTLPVAIVGKACVLTGRAVRANGSQSLSVAGAVVITGTSITIITPTGTIGANFPFIFAAGDIFECSGAYRST